MTINLICLIKIIIKNERVGRWYLSIIEVTQVTIKMYISIEVMINLG